MKRTRTPEHDAFRAAIGRCKNKQHPDYPSYGGRGIRVRFKSFAHFLSVVGLRPSKKHSLDRFPNNDGGYAPGNVRWATMKDQCRNRRQNKWITFQGQLKIITDWAASLGMSSTVLFKRKYRGWCDACTVTLPKGSACAHRLN